MPAVLRRDCSSFRSRRPRIAKAICGAACARVGDDLWGVARAKLGFLALFLCFLPIGSGAAQNLWSAVASDWHASADTVALVTGVLGGIASAVGCLDRRLDSATA